MRSKSKQNRKRIILKRKRKAWLKRKNGPQPAITVAPKADAKA